MCLNMYWVCMGDAQETAHINCLLEEEQVSWRTGWEELLLYIILPFLNLKFVNILHILKINNIKYTSLVKRWSLLSPILVVVLNIGFDEIVENLNFLKFKILRKKWG